MPIVILEGTSQRQFDIGGSMRPGGTPIYVTDSQLKQHQDIIVRVLDEEVKKEVETEEKNEEPENEIPEKSEISLEEMDKDQLEKYALETFDVDIDKRKRLNTLLEEVKKLQNDTK